MVLALMLVLLLKKQRMKILVTGGTGFIGSHTVVELINEGYDVVIVDNLYNSKAMVVDRIEEITGVRPVFYEADVLDRDAMNEIFDKEDIGAVIHFAGYKAVGESTRMPIEYYHNNIGSTQITEKLRTNSNKTKNEIEIYEVKKNNDKKTNGIIESKGYDGNGGCCNDEINCFVF